MSKVEEDEEDEEGMMVDRASRVYDADNPVGCLSIFARVTPADGQQRISYQSVNSLNVDLHEQCHCCRGWWKSQFQSKYGEGTPSTTESPRKNVFVHHCSSGD